MDSPEEAKKRCEHALKMREALLETEPDNSVYQSQVAMTLNNLGALLYDISRPEDTKKGTKAPLE